MKRTLPDNADETNQTEETTKPSTKPDFKHDGEKAEEPVQLAPAAPQQPATNDTTDAPADALNPEEKKEEEKKEEEKKEENKPIFGGGFGSGFGAFGSAPASTGFSSFATANPYTSLGSTTSSFAFGSSFGSFSAFGSSGATTTTTAQNDAAKDTTTAPSTAVDDDDDESGTVDPTNHEDVNVSSKLSKKAVELGEDGEEQAYLSNKMKIYELVWEDVIPEKAAHQPTFGSTLDLGKADKKDDDAKPIKQQRYVERGLAELRLNKITKDGKVSYRVIARHNLKGAILLNEFVYPQSTADVEQHKNIRFTTLGLGKDNKPVTMTFFFKFGDASAAENFSKAVQTAKEELEVKTL